jgi:hypothetical protein
MLVRESRKLHPEFDLDAARRLYDATPTDRNLEGEYVASPHHLYSVETLRDRLALRLGAPIATDIFVFGKGEAPNRECTKVGGLPYWPADRPWPRDARGRPYRYLAQFNFADSQDLVTELPGQMLLLFVPDEDDWFLDSHIRFEWLPLGILPLPTLDPSLAATTAGPFFGTIYRAADYPDAASKAETCMVRGRNQLAIINATKIGGRPHLIQDRDLDGEFLCQLNSIQAAPFVAYPWVNDNEQLKLGFNDQGIHGASNEFVMIDMGVIYIFRTKDGRVMSTTETY